MNYRLNQDGRDAGEFSLEELRRRRRAGELAGTEFVWRPGMDDWQTLDAILQSMPPKSPPPIPALARRPVANRNPRLIWLWMIICVFGAIAIARIGYVATRVVRQVQRVQRRASGTEGVPSAVKPINTNINTRTEADATKRKREFRVRQWIQGYKERGDHTQPYDADAALFLQAWVAENYGGPNPAKTQSAEELANKLAANPSCNDPLILAAAAATSIEMHEKARRLERAVKGFEHSKYKAYTKFDATVELASMLDDRVRIAQLDSSAISLFQQCLTDGSIGPGDQQEIGEILINGWASGFYTRHSEAIYPLPVAATNSFKWLTLMLQGDYHVTLAWNARGGGYSDSVTAEGWQGYNTHLAQAREYFTEAWKLHPEYPEAASRMIGVAMGDSDDEQMRLWFDRATVAQIDYPEAWAKLRWGLRPRWHGSIEAMHALGVAAVQTKRFDTDVPRKFYDVVTDMESEMQPTEGHIYGRSDIWPYFQQMYEGYIAEPSQAADRDGWRSSYALLSYYAGKYDVSRRQLEALNWQPQRSRRADWNVDLSIIPLEVAARTGPLAAEINDLEAVRSEQKSAAKPLRRYETLATSAKADERTRRFIQCRVASLENEARLESGEWVDFLPASTNDLNWIFARGKCRVLVDGALEVESGTDGHSVYSRVRVQPDFEVKGEFEVVRCSNKDFQAGVVMGRPDPDNYDWLAFRMKRNETEGDVASFSRGWTSRQVLRNVSLNGDRNSFDFILQKGRATVRLNDKEIMANARKPADITVQDKDFLVGLGAFNDMNDTVIRYRNVKLRRLGGK
jgi:hypothetical protein